MLTLGVIVIMLINVPSSFSSSLYLSLN